MTLSIRPWAPDDFRALAALMYWYEEASILCYTGATVASVADRVVGFCHVDCLGRVDRVAVLPEFRRRGIATALLRASGARVIKSPNNLSRGPAVAAGLELLEHEGTDQALTYSPYPSPTPPPSGRGARTQ